MNCLKSVVCLIALNSALFIFHSPCLFFHFQCLSIFFSTRDQTYLALRTNEQDAGSFEDPPDPPEAVEAVDAVAADAVLAEAVGGGEAPLSEPPLVKIAAEQVLRLRRRTRMKNNQQ